MSFIAASVIPRIILVSILFAALCVAIPATRVSSSPSPVKHHQPGRVIARHHQRALDFRRVDERVGRPLKQYDPLGQGGRGGRKDGQRGQYSKPSPSPWAYWSESVEEVGIPELAEVEVISESAEVIPELTKFGSESGLGYNIQEI